MSKAGHPATKADQGGQRVPKEPNKGSGNDKKQPTTTAPVKADGAKKATK